MIVTPESFIVLNNVNIVTIKFQYCSFAVLINWSDFEQCSNGKVNSTDSDQTAV